MFLCLSNKFFSKNEIVSCFILPSLICLWSHYWCSIVAQLILFSLYYGFNGFNTIFMKIYPVFFCVSLLNLSFAFADVQLILDNDRFLCLKIEVRQKLSLFKGAIGIEWFSLFEIICFQR